MVISILPISIRSINQFITGSSTCILYCHVLDMKEYAAGLQQVHMEYEYSWWRVCGRSAADSSSYWKSMRQVCSKSAADLPQTLHHTERVCRQVCSKSAQTCRRLFIILKEYAASLQQVCGRPAADSSSYWKICGKSAASLRQTCRRLFIILKSMRQVCGKSAADLPQTLHHTERVCGKSCGKSAAKLICMWKRWLSAAGLLQICGKSAAGVCGRLISFLWVRLKISNLGNKSVISYAAPWILKEWQADACAHDYLKFVVILLPQSC